MDADDETHFLRDGFEGYPRSLPDNCVEYMLFIINDKQDAPSLLAEMEGVRKAASQLCRDLTKDYIWQRDAFHLKLKRDSNLAYLHGITNYGDSIEDEWLIVYLLRELTTSFPTLWSRVFDSDGEFLLVEAANVLPKWLSPEIDSNRVWIHQGMLKILPLPASSGEKRPLSLAEAVDHIKSNPDSLIHSTFVEAEAFYRLERYPGQIYDSIHCALVTIPRKLAHILHQLPMAVAPAIEAFYLRDPVTMKPLISPSGKSIHFPPEDLVTIGVRFTKVLFAQLKSQRFTPPPLWNSIIETAETRVSEAEGLQQDLARLELGMKTTSGFEMLAASVDKKDNRLAREFAIVLGDAEEDGDQVLPTDKDIAGWPYVNKEDDDSWLNINFEDFEEELQGRQRSTPKKAQSGFGSASTQADLRKVVSRFEAFLNDDTAGLEGAELEDMDEDDDISEGTDGPGSEDEDKEVSFDEDQFSNMMREMMGLPPKDFNSQGESSESVGWVPSRKTRENLGAGVGNETDDEDDEEDQDEIKQLATQMELELNALGALKLDAETKPTNPLQHLEIAEHEGDNSEEEVDVNYNLAKNLLESFKSQSGMAGPTSNLLGIMGLRLPRDEDDEHANQD
ncbi:SGT1-domain-containing protein [Xylariaceae sp. FL0016]|nr:SGT1-domain-containing protein [Xylariaceae sp. FL0016]